MPVLSIIIPAYNAARFIGDTLSMLVSQGLEDCEVIVVNDGSTDDTGAICDEYVKRHANIKLISKANGGVSVARNTGLASASGDYIYFLDSDDMLTDGTLGYYKKTLREKTGIDIIGFGYKSVSHNKTTRNYVYGKYNGMLHSGKEFLRLYFLKKINCHICGTIFSRKFLQENNLTFTPV